MAERNSKVAVQCAAEEIQVLKRDRFIEAELVAKRVDLVGLCVDRQQDRRWIAGQPRQGKDDDGDADQDDDPLAYTACDVAQPRVMFVGMR